MSKGLFALAMRLVITAAALCVGLGAMGVDVVGTLHLGEHLQVIRYIVGVCGALSMYAFVVSCCSDCGSCKA